MLGKYLKLKIKKINKIDRFKPPALSRTLYNKIVSFQIFNNANSDYWNADAEIPTKARRGDGRT